MRLPYPRSGRLLPVCILILFLFAPAFAAEEPSADEDLSGGIPFMEDPEGITVTGTRTTSQQIRVITREEIESRGTADLMTLLQECLDIGLTRRGPYGSQADINLRGFDTERTAVLIDGIPANSPRSGEFDFTIVNPGAIERIEVIYGGSDAKYNVSGALGGVINIITVKRQPPGLRLGGSLSNTSALPGIYYNRLGGRENPRWQDLADAQNLNLSADLGLGNFSWSAAWFGNRAANHFLYTASDNSRRRREHSEVYDTGFNGSFVWDLPDYSRLILSGDIYYGGKNFPVPEGADTCGGQKDFSTRQNVMLDMPRIFRDDLAMEASLSHSWQTLDYEAPAEDSLHKEHALTAINRWSWYALEKLTLRSGFDYRYIHIDSTSDGLHYSHDGGVYIGAEYALRENFLFIPSVKAVFRDSAAVPVPKLGLLWRVNETVTLKNNYYRSFKFPNFDALYWDQPGFYGNPDLKPEDGWGGDLSAEFRPEERLLLEGAFYAQWIENSIHWSNISGAWRPENTAEAAFFGWDFRLRAELPLPFNTVNRIIPGLSYKYLLSYIVTSRNGEHLGFSAGIRIPYAPMHTLGFSLEIPWHSGSFIISGHYESLRYADYTITPGLAMNTKKLEPLFLLNVNFNQRINKHLRVFAALRNILNKSSQSFYDFHMPGLTLTAGIGMDFDPH